MTIEETAAPDTEALRPLLPPFLDVNVVADALEGIASGLRPRDAEKLTSLGEAVRGGPSLPLWAAVNLQDHIEARAVAEQMVPEPSLRRIMQIAEVARNAFLFAPVLFTWYALSRAVSAYHDLIGAEPNQRTEPFLLLWQDGFRERVGLLTLGNVALIDGGLVLIVLTLTVFTAWWNQHLTSERQRRLAQVTSGIKSRLADAGLILAAHRKPPDLAFLELSSVSQALLGDIAEQRLQVQHLTESQKEQGDALARSLSTLERVGRRLDAAADAIVDAAETSKLHSQHVAESVQAVAEAQQQLAQGVSSLSDGFAATVVSQQSYGEDLRAVAERLQAATESLSGTERESREGLDSFLGGVEELLRVLASERAAQGTLALAVSSSTLGVETALLRLEEGADLTRNLAEDIRGLAEELPSVGLSLAQWLPAMVDQQTQLIDALRAAAPAPAAPRRGRRASAAPSDGANA